MATEMIMPSGNRFQDLTGKTFGRFTVLKFDRIVDHNAKWICRCECGHVQAYWAHDIKNPKNQSRKCSHRTTESIEIDRVEIKEIPGHPGYFARSDGTIWSDWSHGRKPARMAVCHRLSGRRHKSGHIYVSTRFSKSLVAVHHLMLFAFKGPRPEGLECRHLNGNPADNQPDNLEWGTRSENVLDCVRHGTHARSSRYKKRQELKA